MKPASPCGTPMPIRPHRLRRRTISYLVLATLVAFCGGLLHSVESRGQAGHERHGEQGQGRHGNPADLKAYLEHLDSPERDKTQLPSDVIRVLGLKPGMAVADLGSGSGYFTRRLAEAVTDEGLVYAVDVEPELLAYVKESFEHVHEPHRVEYILADPDHPKLKTESVDLIFLCNVAHHIPNRGTYFANLASALKSGGRIAIIDFYHDARSGDLGFPKGHLVSREKILTEMANAGYRLIREHGFLPRQYFLEFAPAH